MQRASGDKEGSQVVMATPEHRALHLQAVWLEKEKARRASPRDEKAQRAEYLARCAMFDQACRLQQRRVPPN
jgi:hypothetical protein